MTHCNRRVRCGGFSLIELVLVGLIVSMVGLMAMPRFANASARMQADAAARRVMADLMLAREQARAKSTQVKLAFDVDLETLTAAGLGGMNDAQVSYVSDYSQEPYRADLMAVDFGGQAVLSFDGFGQPSSGGAVTVGVGQVKRVIVLDADSGEVSLQ